MPVLNITGLKFCKSFTLIYWETVFKYVHQANVRVNLIVSTVLEALECDQKIKSCQAVV